MDDIETEVLALLRKHEGVDIVLSIRYNDGSGHHHVVKTEGDEAILRRLIRMAWQSLPPEIDESDYTDGDDE